MLIVSFFGRGGGNVAGKNKLFCLDEYYKTFRFEENVNFRTSTKIFFDLKNIFFQYMSDKSFFNIMKKLVFFGYILRLSLLCPKVSNQDRSIFGCQVIYAYKVRYSIEPREQIYLKKVEFFSFSKTW